MHLKWHPSADYTIATASMQGGARVWDVQQGCLAYQYELSKGVPWNLHWNYDGSLFGLLTKNREFHLVDPRNPGAAIVAKAHDNSKGQSF